MRALATISAVILLGAGMTSCDMPGSQQQQAATTPPCNCGTTPSAATATSSAPTEHTTRFSYAPRHHYVRHHYYAEARYNLAHHHSRYENDLSQQSVDAYDYVSSSRVTRSYSADSEYARYEGGYSDGRIVWVDGYGRGYFNNGPVTVAATMRGKRLAPYHGYDEDCPDKGERR